MSTTLYPQQLIPPAHKSVQENGALSQALFYLVRALFQRTGGNSGNPITVGNGLAAHPSVPPMLSNNVNEVTQGAGAVRLQNLQPGQSQTVYNGTGAGIDIHPPSGGQVDGVAGPYSLASGKTQVFTAYSLVNGSTAYRSQQLG